VVAAVTGSGIATSAVPTPSSSSVSAIRGA